VCLLHPRITIILQQSKQNPDLLVPQQINGSRCTVVESAQQKQQKRLPKNQTLSQLNHQIQTQLPQLTTIHAMIDLSNFIFIHIDRLQP
jgi:hypothetical protein